MPDARCFFTVVRYVPDARRDEARNIGVLVVSPDEGFAGARFLLSRANLQKGSSRFRILESLLRTYEIEMPGTTAPLFANLPSGWDRDRLQQLHEECGNLIQFTAPAPALDEPSELLARLYRERVKPRAGGRGRGPTWTPSRTVDTFRAVFTKHSKETAIDETGAVPLTDGIYNFDLTVKNGKPLYVLETVSLRVQNLARVEHDAAWFAYVWPHVESETHAMGLLFAERDKANVEAERCFDRIHRWARDVKIDVRDDPSTDVREFAEAIVEKVPGVELVAALNG
jgi:DUF3037 family protein